MIRNSLRDIEHTVAAMGGAAAEVHVFEPERVKRFVEAVQLAPRVASNHQKSASRLFCFVQDPIIPIQPAKPPIHRITGP
jgi:hypothetical protein